MKRVLIVSVIVIVVALFWRWFNDVNVPEGIPETFKVKVIDAAMRTFKSLVTLLIQLGVTYPYSPLMRSMGHHWLTFQFTGWPWWRYSGQGLKVEDKWLDGVHVRMYEPTATLGDKKRPVFIYFHGGAFSWLSIDVYEPFTSRIAEESHVVVISVNYRLSPEFVFPVPRDDCRTVVSHVLRHGDAMGLDTSRVAIGGDSAGGNLAASLSLEFQQQLKLQVVLVPAVQPLDTLTASNVENAPYMGKSIHDRNTFMCYLVYGGLNWSYLPHLLTNDHVSPQVKATVQATKVDTNTLVTPEAVRTPELRKRKLDTTSGNVTVWNHVKDVFLNPYFAPLLAEDNVLAKVPHAYVMTAGYDVIRDDGIMYYNKLKKLGVRAVWKNYEEGFHNALMFHSGPLKLQVGERILRDIVDYLHLHL